MKELLLTKILIPESAMPAPGYCKVFLAEVLDTDVPMDRKNEPRYYEALFLSGRLDLRLLAIRRLRCLPLILARFYTGIM
jgi:hypothetical protein